MTWPPRNDVLACVHDESLQAEHSIETEFDGESDPRFREQLRRIRKEHIAAGAPRSIRWIYFRSPDSTWAGECGSAGWLLWDPELERQLDYEETVIS